MYLTTRLGIDKDKFKIVTDGVWDIQVQLMMETAKKGVTLGEKNIYISSYQIRWWLIRYSS